VLPPQIFIHAKYWPNLDSEHPNGDGVPEKKNFWSWKCKIWLKIQRVSPYNFGLVGVSSQNFFQTTWWTLVHKQKSYSAHIDPTEVLVHCKLTQVNTTRGSRIQISESLASCHCWERNFDYANGLSTRTCGAGRPYIGLWPILLVINIFYLFKIAVAACHASGFWRVHSSARLLQRAER